MEQVRENARRAADLGAVPKVVASNRLGALRGDLRAAASTPVVGFTAAAGR
jgi:hypothetical protein